MAQMVENELLTGIDEKRIRIIKYIAQELEQEEKPLAILLSGSTARKIYSDDSDIDIVAFFSDYKGDQLECLELEGISVNIERYPATKFIDLPPVPQLEDKQLREAGRFSESILLYSRWNELDKLLDKFRKALFTANRAHSLLSVAQSTLYKAASESDAQQMWWLLQGCATALAKLRLSFSPYKYQKPKWLMHDVSLLSDKFLSSILNYLYSIGPYSAKEILTKVEKCLLEACKQAKFPLLVLDPSEIYEFRYMHRTLLDAKSLLNRDEEGCKYAAITTLRQMATILSDPQIISKRQLASQYCEQWMKFCYKILFPNEGKSLEMLLLMASNLQKFGEILARICKEFYLNNIYPESTMFDNLEIG